MNQDNMSMLFDFYEMTMGNGYFYEGMKDQIAYFDVFFRRVPDDGGFAIAAGLEQVVKYIENLHFTAEDIALLREQKVFGEEFLSYLQDFHFTGDIYAVPEGTVVFPGEPILTVRAPVIEAQLMETYILLSLNHQSLIATKSNRIVRAASGRPVAEFGARRAQGSEAAVMGARASYIAGCASTSCVLATQKYGVPASGTMAHSWVQMFDHEYDAFKAYCEKYPHQATLLIDTYDVLNSGLPNAIRAFKEILWPQGIHSYGVRIDSGDIAYLTKKVRKILDEAGLPECKIVISNSLDEYLIQEILRQGACIDAFGVGERLITSESDPVFGGVYKLAATEKEGKIIPKIKISENVTKITTPHFKKVYRFYDQTTGKAEADLVCIYDEKIQPDQPLEIFDPDFPWKKKTLTHFTMRELQIPIFKAGKCVYQLPDVEEIRTYCMQEIQTLWEEVTRFSNPHQYYVDLSSKLWTLKKELIAREREKR